MPSRLCAASFASIVLLPVAHAAAQLTSDIVTGSLQIGLEPVTNVAGPSLDLTHAGDGTNRLFLAGQNTGDVRLFKNDALVSTPFLDVNATTGATGAALPLMAGGERGLLGMAFHPNFAVPGQPGFGKFYTYTSESLTTVADVDFIHDELDGTSSAPANRGDHDSVVREWTVNPSNPDQVLIDQTSTTTRRNSGREVLRIRQPQSNHNGGAMKFGPDGMLYIALGDGGGGNDQSGTSTDWPTDGHTNASSTVRGNAQDVQDYELARNENVLGKILRIDPRDPDTTPAGIGPESTNGEYRVPANNPRMGAADGADEIFAYGLRNPFRMSFDRVGGALYAGDVGQGQREEINVITSGGNYGWVYWEGTRPNFSEPAGGITEIAPIGEYTHADGIAVIGGFVYRGSNIPELYGKYVFGDLGAGSVGRVFYMEAGGGTISEFQYLLNAPGAELYGFGEDRDGELYAMFADGNVRRILGKQWLATGGGSWASGANWLGPIPNGTGVAANFLGRVRAGTSAPAVVTLDGARTVGSLLFNNDSAGSGVGYRIAPGTGGTLAVNNGLSPGSIKVVRGNHEITAPVTFASHTEIDIASTGSLNVTGAVTVNTGRSLTKTGAGSAALAGGVTLLPNASLSVSGGTLDVRNVTGGGGVFVNDGGRLNVTPNGGPAGTSRVSALRVSNAGKLDLTNNRFIVTSSDIGTASGGSYTGLSGFIQRGKNGDAWDGNGIMTSMPDAATGLTTIGISTAAQARALEPGQTALWSGATVSASDVLIMYTYAGDANLDGAITGDDYSHIDFGILFPGMSGYANGDFNYDGFVTGDDYSVIDLNILLQGAPFSTSGVAAASVTPVPEPGGAVAAVVALASLSLAGARKRPRRAYPPAASSC